MSRKKKSFDEDAFDAFMEETLSDEDNKPKKSEKNRKDEELWWMNDSSDLQDNSRKGKSFLKGRGTVGQTLEEVDTLNELVEKDRFFNDLEGNASQTVDYSKLNKALEESSTIEGDTKLGGDHLLARIEKCLEKKTSPVSSQQSGNSEEVSVKKSGFNENYKEELNSDALGYSEAEDEIDGTESAAEDNYNDDIVEDHQRGHFQEDQARKADNGLAYNDDDSKEVVDNVNSKKPSLLSNVSLLDSRDTTLGLPQARPRTIVQSTPLKVEDDEKNNLKSSPPSLAMITSGQMYTAESDAIVTTTTNDDLEALQSALRNVAEDMTATDELPQPANKYQDEASDLGSDRFQRPPPTEAERDLDKLFADFTTTETEKPSRPKPEARKSKSKNKFSKIKSSGYGRPPQPQARNLTPESQQTHQSKSNIPWSPKHSFEYKTKGTSQLPVKVSSFRDNQLLASVESFAHYVKDHFVEDTNINSAPISPGEPYSVSLQREVQEWQEQFKEERKLVVKFQAELAAQERKFSREFEELKSAHQQEVFTLKQENFVLSAKVSSLNKQGDLIQQVKEGAMLEGVSKEQMMLLENEIREQEKLLAGYEQENKKLYQEVKKMKTTSKDMEGKLFKENQKLTIEIMSLRQDLDVRELQMKSQGHQSRTLADIQIAKGGVGTAILGAGRITELNVQLKEAQNKIKGLHNDLALAEQSNKELEDHIERLVTDRERWNDAVQHNSDEASRKIHVSKERYENEIQRLKNRIKWYAENQELLDRDAKAIHEKKDEIKKLQNKIEELQKKLGEQNQLQRDTISENKSDSKKIQDLQRQVREMENIMRKRNPNSIPALIWAASAVPDSQPPVKPPSTQFLENRIKKLEAELQEKDDDSKRSLRVMEQKYNVIKMQYEDRIHDLESRPAVGRPHTHDMALQRELETVKELNRKKVAQLEDEKGQLKEKIRKYNMNNTLKQTVVDEKIKSQQSDLELDLRRQVERLQHQLEQKNNDIRLLDKKMDLLGKEKRIAEEREVKTREMMRDHKASKKSKSKSTPPINSPRQELRETLKPYDENFHIDKEYEPQSFAGTHISDLSMENEHLKSKINDLELSIDKQRIDYQKALAQNESLLRQTRESLYDEMMAVKSAHQREVQRLLSDQALQFSASRVAELQSKIDTQEVMIKHLKQQTSEVEIVEENLAASRIREISLENEIKQLLDELREAKKTHTPRMRHYETLLDRIKHLESKNENHDHKLHNMMIHRSTPVEAEEEIAKWKKLVDVKNEENEHFRQELDSMLQVLRELQRQGVVVPSKTNVNY